MPKTAKDIHFRPFTVLLGIIMGTVFAVAFGLGVVCLLFWILQDEAPRLAAESGPLLISTGIFTALTCFAGLSFYGSLWQFAWRHVPMAMLWIGLLLTGRYYWP
jgi:hypothetical protein